MIFLGADGEQPWYQWLKLHPSIVQHRPTWLLQEQVLEDWLRRNEDGWASPLASLVSPDRLGQLFPLLSTVGCFFWVPWLRANGAGFFSSSKIRTWAFFFPLVCGVLEVSASYIFTYYTHIYPICIYTFGTWNPVAECLILENEIQEPLPLNLLDQWTRFNPTVLGALGHPCDRSRWSCAATAVPAVPWCTALWKNPGGHHFRGELQLKVLKVESVFGIFRGQAEDSNG